MNTFLSIIETLKKPLHDLAEIDRANVSKLIERLVTEGALHSSKHWAAHMSPAIESPALLGQLLAGLHSGNLLSSELYPQLANIEKQMLDWLCQLFDQPYGHFTHGGTYANLEALWQAREHSQGSSTIVYGSQAAHYSISKACHILGLNFKTIATNDYGEISVEELRKACRQQSPVAIVATAGTSSCGAIDHIMSCIALAKQFSSWCHVDAAWGGVLVLTEEAELLAGVAQADSICFDPHKALGQPRPCGVLLYQRPLKAVDNINYLSLLPAQTLLGSRGGELFLPLWCSLLLSGEQQLMTQINTRRQQAKDLYAVLKKRTNWWLLFSATGMVCFRPSQSCDLSALVQKGCLSQSTINEHAIYRVIFASDTSQANNLLIDLEPYF